jgi:hypothetical protein
MQPMPVTMQVFVIQIDSADGSTWTPIQGHLCKQLTDNQWEVFVLQSELLGSRYKAFLETAHKHERLVCVRMAVLKTDKWVQACLYGVVRSRITDFGNPPSIIGRIAWLNGSHDPKASPQSPLDWESFRFWQRFVIECASYRASLGAHLTEGG